MLKMADAATTNFEEVLAFLARAQEIENAFAAADTVEELFWKYKPWNAKKMAKRGPAMAVEIGKIAEVQERERASMAHKR